MSKKKKDVGCHVSCWVGWTIGVVIVVLMSLLTIMVLGLVDFRFTTSGGDSNRDRTCRVEQVEASALWRECGRQATSRKECLGQCNATQATPSPMGPTVGTGPGRVGPPAKGNGVNPIPTCIPGTSSTGGDTRPPMAILPTPPPLTDVRLNRTWLPRHYNIALQPWVYAENNARLNGSVEIYMTSSQTTREIVLHAINITIDQKTMELRERNYNGRLVSIKNVEYDNQRQYIKISTTAALTPGTEYVLKLDYDGTLLHALKGFYRSSYMYRGDTRFFAVSQFETTDARRAFPCFDEPDFKATFTVTLVRKPGFVSLSNMDTASIQTRGEWVWETFTETPVMSPYIVAFFVGQFVSRQRTTPKGTRVRVWSQPNYINYTEVALNVTGTILEAYEVYTDIRYPLTKTDQVALPEFAAGAMENWGLITYLESAILVNPMYTTMVEEEQVVVVIAHELAHQWFGNLVTLRWWDDTFLNEALTTYISHYVGVPAARPTWNSETNFLKMIQTEMISDTSYMSQPVRLLGLEQLRDLHKAFSQITYVKGAAVIKMIRYFLKEPTFSNALRAYLSEFSYGTTTKSDLVSVFERLARASSRVTWDTSRANLGEIMTSWLDQINYPLVEVTDLQNGQVRVKQSRFADQPDMQGEWKTPFSNYSWYIPFTYANENGLRINDTKLRWIYRDDVVNFRDSETPGWKLANIFSQGFYRVKYDENTRTSIIRQLMQNYKVIPVESRSEINDDAVALANMGYTDEIAVLDTTRYLVNETEYVAFYPFFERRLPTYKNLLARTPTYTDLSKYVIELILPNYNRLGWMPKARETPADQALRVLVIKEACAQQYQPCVLEALKQYQQLTRMVEQTSGTNTRVVNPIHPDLRQVVYCTAISHGGLEVFTSLLGMVVTLQSYEDYLGQEVGFLIFGIACAQDTVTINEAMMWAFRLNISSLFEMLARQPSVVDAVWNYLDRNWARIPSGVSKEAIIWVLTDYFGAESDLRKLRHLLDDHPDISRFFAQDVIEKVKGNMNWVNMNEKPIQEWLTVDRLRPIGDQSSSSGRRRRSIDELHEKLDITGERHQRVGNGLPMDKYTTYKSYEKISFGFKDGKVVEVVSSQGFKRDSTSKWI